MYIFKSGNQHVHEGVDSIKWLGWFNLWTENAIYPVNQTKASSTLIGAKIAYFIVQAILVP